MLQGIDAHPLVAEDLGVEDPDQLQQLAQVGGGVGEDQKVGAQVIGDVAARRQVGSEQLGHFGRRHEVQGHHLQYPLGRGPAALADLQGKLAGVLAGKDAVDGALADHGGPVDLQDGFQQRSEVAAPHAAVGVDVDRALHPGVQQVVQLELAGQAAHELGQAALHAVEPHRRVPGGRGGSRLPSGGLGGGFRGVPGGVRGRFPGLVCGLFPGLGGGGLRVGRRVSRGLGGGLRGRGGGCL